MTTVGLIFLFIVNTTTMCYKPGIGTKKCLLERGRGHSMLEFSLYYT
jgi:hypothetical protein